MKQHILATALGLFALVGISAQAATATGNFDVTINLTSACKVSTAPTAAFTYTSFQATAATFSSSFNIMCTKTLPITSITLCLLYTSPSPRDGLLSRMPSSA